MKDIVAETMLFQELNDDQRRETVNTRQRFDAFRTAQTRLAGYKGSMVWADSKGTTYLRRSYYDGRRGVRRQTSLGPRSPETERLKAEFDSGRIEAKNRGAAIEDVLTRQAAVNRALGLGRVPLIAARILRALDDAGLLGSGIRVVGTNAIYAYEAVAGIFVDPGVTTTEDLDLLLDARASLSMIVAEDEEAGIISLLKRVDHSFVRSDQTFRAVNKSGYLVDLIKPMRNPPWKDERSGIGDRTGDLEAVEIVGLAWLENAPAFEAVAIDERGAPLRLVVPDPRAFAVHKLWLSTQSNRDPVQRRRDVAQAETVAQLVTRYLPHLPYDEKELEMLPLEQFERAKPLFQPFTTIP